MATHGGARPGSGPKPKAEKYGVQIEKAEQRIAAKLPKLLDNLFLLAAGVTVKERGADGKAHVYVKAPDRRANEYLVNRVMGKPTEHHDITSADEAIIGIGYLITTPPMGGDPNGDRTSDA